MKNGLSQTPKNASPFGLKVARILDDIWALYNMPRIDKVNFGLDDRVELRIHKSIATYDFDELTQLVVRCHDACVRLSIRGSGTHLHLHFSPRERETDSMVTRHPTMAQAIERVRTRNYFSRNDTRGELPQPQPREPLTDNIDLSIDVNNPQEG